MNAAADIRRTPPGANDIVVFDVDGTLVAGAAELHLAAFADALAETCGVADPFDIVDGRLCCDGVPVHGLTDAHIARLCLRSAAADLDEGALTSSFMAAMVAAYSRRLRAGADVGSLLPGVLDLLDALSARGVRCGLLTGNTEEVWMLKQAALGLTGRFFGGAFGGEAVRRAELFPFAFAAAGEPGPVVYVGDTPLDVAAAREASVPVVAVATGRFSSSELAGADVVLESLADTDLAVSALLRSTR